MGDAVYPVLSTRPTVGGPHSDSTDVGETTGGYTADLLAPERIQASFIYKRVDAMRFPAMDPSLRMALNGGLEEKLDYEVIAGTDGLLTGANLPNNNVAAVTTFADYISRFGYSRGSTVDTPRSWAISGPSQAPERMATWAASTARNNADYSVVDSLMAKTAGVRVSAHVPAVTAANKQNAVDSAWLPRRDMVQPTWQAVTIIVDEYGELAGKGEIEVTAVLGMNTKILRADGFHKQQSPNRSLGRHLCSLNPLFFRASRVPRGGRRQPGAYCRHPAPHRPRGD